MQAEIVPNNILMIGATGVGKTEIARRLAAIADAPFVKVEATKFTEVGYVGRDVESMVRDLAEQAVNMVKAKKKEQVKEQAAQAVEDMILDALIPPVQRQPRAAWLLAKRARCPHSDQELNERTRERFRQKIKNGELEDRKIEIRVQQSGAPGVGVMGARAWTKSRMMNMQEMMGNMMPKKTQKAQSDHCRSPQAPAGRGGRQAHRYGRGEGRSHSAKPKTPASSSSTKSTKWPARSSKSGGGGPDVSREGVQRDLLPIVEGSCREHQVRHHQHRPYPVHRRRSVPRLQALRPDSGTAGPLPHPRGAAAA